MGIFGFILIVGFSIWAIWAWDRLWANAAGSLPLDKAEREADRLLYEADPEFAVELGYHVPSCTCEACGGPK